MKTFAVNGRFLSQNITGVQRYAYEITRALALEVACGSAPGFDIVAPEHLKNTIDADTRIRLQRRGPFRGHVWEQTTLPAKVGGLLINLCNSGPLTKRRQITCIHGANTFVYPDSYNRSFRWSQKVLLHGMGALSTHVTTVSQASAELLYELGIVPRSKPITIAPNGYEHARLWQPDRSRIREKLRADRPFVLLIGSMAPHKNVRLILSLAKQLDAAGIDIAVAGGSFNVFSGNISDEKASNVVRLGYVSDDDLACLLRHAACFVFPSIVEGFGLPLVEAMAWECPIISSNTASMPEVCGDAAILLDPRKPDDWLEAIVGLKSDDAKRRELIARGNEQVKKFSWRESARKYLSLVEQTS